MPDMPLIVWTQFHYLYRDAGNFKVFGSVILKGKLNEVERSTVFDAMDEDGRFVAEQIGLPVLYESLHQYTDGPSDVDVCTHEFSHFEEIWTESSRIDGYIWGEVTDFADRFERVQEWRLEMSPNANML